MTLIIRTQTAPVTLNSFQGPSRRTEPAVRAEKWTPDQVRGDDEGEGSVFP